MKSFRVEDIGVDVLVNVVKLDVDIEHLLVVLVPFDKSGIVKLSGRLAPRKNAGLGVLIFPVGNFSAMSLRTILVVLLLTR